MSTREVQPISEEKPSYNSRQLARTWPYTRYKDFRASLCKAAEQWFHNKGLKTHPNMRYCLNGLDQWPVNIICKDVADYIRDEQKCRSEKDPFPLHKYLHHGLSSQAMVFNLIGPLVVRKDLTPLRYAVESLGVSWPEGEVEATFEHYDRNVFNEDAGQPTSIDLLLKDSSDRNNIFIEAKFVEKEFGGCSVFAGGDCEGKNPYPDKLTECYLHHIGRKYWERLKELGFSDSLLVKGAICPFANYYQFFREAAFAFAKNGVFILLHDVRNPAFLKTTKEGTKFGGLWPFLYESIPQNRRRQIGRLTVQMVVDAIQESGRHEDWIGDFKKKYGLQETDG